LTVYVAGITYTNDDRAPGDLSSLAEFQAPGYDIQAYAIVTNRGQYGKDQWYEVAVQEVVATPTPTLTPTPELGDEYEPDDPVPGPISVGETQTHNFYPEGDVDRVQFRVKKDRLYEVSTSNLALGVDTEIAVAVNGVVRDGCRNDDAAPGLRASRVLFQAEADGTAVVTIENLDRCGPDRTYQISVVELEPTPTPTPTETPVPTETPTPTPHPGDAYEPDDIPKPIGVAETQTHSFHPDGDVDRVTFGVKGCRLYALTTSSLAAGVDTRIVVEIDGETCPEWQNDDAAHPFLESEDRKFLESEVRLMPEHDGTAVATITNVKGGQYGADETYDLTLSLLSPLVDYYEPDDPFARAIAVGGVQEHSFYPDGDRDLVKFLAKAGLHYAVYTSNLALGVDTHLKVAMDNTFVAENDDYYPPETGNFVSAVCFQAPTDGTVVVSITNLQQQYGVDETYEIAVNVVPILQVTPLYLPFPAVVEGGANPPSQEVTVRNAGGGLLAWDASKDVFWLNVEPSSGFASGTQPSVMTVSVDTTGLAARAYTGHIQVTGTSLCTQNASQTITVTLEVLAPTATPTPTSSPTSTPASTATPTGTPTPASSSRRAPGMAFLAPSSTSSGPLSPLCAPGPPDTGNFPSATTEAVDFVIVLELKRR